MMSTLNVLLAAHSIPIGRKQTPTVMSLAPVKTRPEALDRIAGIQLTAPADGASYCQSQYTMGPASLFTAAPAPIWKHEQLFSGWHWG